MSSKGIGIFPHKIYVHKMLCALLYYRIHIPGKQLYNEVSVGCSYP